MGAVRLPWKQFFLRSLVISVAICAAFGIWAILRGRLGSLEIRILLTTLTIAGASICGLGCGACLGRGRGQWMARAGIGLALVAGALVIVGIWTDTESEEFWQTTLTASFFAVACAHVSLLALARLAPRYLWVMVAAHLTIFGLEQFKKSLLRRSGKERPARHAASPMPARRRWLA